MANPGGMRSVAWRAALAVGLMFGFYGLAVGMVAALVGLPIVVGSYVKAGAVVKLALFCGVGAFLILRSILPRRDRFEVPGPVLDRGWAPAALRRAGPDRGRHRPAHAGGGLPAPRRERLGDAPRRGDGLRLARGDGRRPAAAPGAARGRAARRARARVRPLRRRRREARALGLQDAPGPRADGGVAGRPQRADDEAVRLVRGAVLPRVARGFPATGAAGRRPGRAHRGAGRDGAEGCARSTARRSGSTPTGAS